MKSLNEAGWLFYDLIRVDIGYVDNNVDQQRIA